MWLENLHNPRPRSIVGRYNSDHECWPPGLALGGGRGSPGDSPERHMLDESRWSHNVIVQIHVHPTSWLVRFAGRAAVGKPGEPCRSPPSSPFASHEAGGLMVRYVIAGEIGTARVRAICTNLVLVGQRRGCVGAKRKNADGGGRVSEGWVGGPLSANISAALRHRGARQVVAWAAGSIVEFGLGSWIQVFFFFLAETYQYTTY